MSETLIKYYSNSLKVTETNNYIHLRLALPQKKGFYKTEILSRGVKTRILYFGGEKYTQSILYNKNILGRSEALRRALAGFEREVRERE